MFNIRINQVVGVAINDELLVGVVESIKLCLDQATLYPTFITLPPCSRYTVSIRVAGEWYSSSDVVDGIKELIEIDFGYTVSR